MIVNTSLVHAQAPPAPRNKGTVTCTCKRKAACCSINYMITMTGVIMSEVAIILYHVIVID